MDKPLTDSEIEKLSDELRPLEVSDLLRVQRQNSEEYFLFQLPFEAALPENLRQLKVLLDPEYGGTINNPRLLSFILSLLPKKEAPAPAAKKDAAATGGDTAVPASTN